MNNTPLIFSQTEAKNLTEKRVWDKCVEENSQKVKSGKIIGYSGKMFDNIFTLIKWDDEKHPYTGYPKDYFERCMEVEK